MKNKEFENLLDKALSMVDNENIVINNEEHEFTREHNKRMEKILKKESPKKGIIHILPRMISVALIAIMLLGLSVMSVGAWRRTLFQMLFADRGTNAKIEFSKEEQNRDSGGEQIHINYIPKGFVREDKIESGNACVFIYSNGIEMFEIAVHSINAEISIDIETENSERIAIKEFDAFYSEKDVEKTIVMYDDKYSYVINGNISKKEMVKIAESLVEK